MEAFIVKAQIASSEADDAMQRGNFKLVYQKYEEASNLYAAALRRATDPKTTESLKQFQAHFAEKAKQMSDYLESDNSIIVPDEPEDTNTDNTIDYDQSTSNFDDYYGHHMNFGSPIDDDTLTREIEKKTSTSPLEKLVLPFAKGYQTVKNFVYSNPKQTNKGGVYNNSPSAGSASNSLEDSFFFIQPQEEHAALSVGTSPSENPLRHIPQILAKQQPVQTQPLSPRGGGSNSNSNSTSSSSSSSPSSNPQQASFINDYKPTSTQSSHNHPTVKVEGDMVFVEKAKLREMTSELIFLRGMVVKLREQNAKLLQRSNVVGMHELVRENTQLKRSIMNIQKKTPWNMTKSVGIGISQQSNVGGDVLNSLDAIKIENINLKNRNEILEQKLEGWQKKWDELVSNAQRRKSVGSQQAPPHLQSTTNPSTTSGTKSSNTMVSSDLAFENSTTSVNSDV